MRTRTPVLVSSTLAMLIVLLNQQRVQPIAAPHVVTAPTSPMTTPQQRPSLVFANDAAVDPLAEWLGGHGVSVAGCPSHCRPQPNCEMRGTAVGLSGPKNVQLTASECCESCKAHAAATTTNGSEYFGRRPCNVWVFCADAAGCGADYGHCWLKHQDDPLDTPVVGGLGIHWGKRVPWTSGVIGVRASARRASLVDPFGVPQATSASHVHRASARFVALTTRHGAVRVRLAHAASPNATRWLLQQTAYNDSGWERRLYRAEPVPAGWGRAGFYGPPYAMVQGSFGGAPLDETYMAEGGIVLRRGAVLLIDHGPEFLIALANHPEWATSHTFRALYHATAQCDDTSPARCAYIHSQRSPDLCVSASFQHSSYLQSYLCACGSGRGGCPRHGCDRSHRPRGET